MQPNDNSFNVKHLKIQNKTKKTNLLCDNVNIYNLQQNIIIYNIIYMYI